MAIMMMFLRWGVEKFIFRPIGLQVGMKDSRKSYPRSNPALEAEFRKSKNLTQTTTENLAKALSMSQLEVKQGLEIPSVVKISYSGPALVQTKEISRAALNFTEVLRNRLEV